MPAASKSKAASAADSASTKRRDYPTFMLPIEPPTMPQTYAKQTYRERIRGWNQCVTGDLNPLPYVVYLNYFIKLTFYWYFFSLVLRNPEVGIFEEDNVKRMVIYNILGDVTGFHSTGGPLGFRMKYFFVTWYNLLMPGSITVPLVCKSSKRTVLQSIGYVVYLGTLVNALCSPVITTQIVWSIVGMLAVLTPFDFVTFQASRGEHSGYMLVCLLLPWKHAIFGMRMCQAALWSWAGMAKFGPWMAYVNAFMMPNSKFIAALGALGIPIKRILYRDAPQDVNPSGFLRFLAHLACLGEISLGPLNLFLPQYGVPLAFAFHVFILSMTPFASVMEWNAFCLYLTCALFQQNFDGYVPFDIHLNLGAMHPLMARFLITVLVLVPLADAGNWRFTWHIVDKKAKKKLRKLKTLEGPFIGENARMLWSANPHFCDQLEDYITGNMVFFPHFRPLIPMMEQLEKRMKWKSDDYVTLFNEIFLNAVCGWCLGTGFYVKKPFFKALTSTCGFEKNECFCAVFEPMGLHDHTAEWHLVDVTDPDKKIMHGKIPYSKLQNMQPCDMTMEMFEESSLLSKDD